MVSFNLLAGVLTVCLAVSLCRSEVDEHSNNILMAKLNGRLVSEERKFSNKRGDNDVRAKLNPSRFGFCENDTHCVSPYEKEEKNADSATVGTEKGTEEDSMFMEGIRDLRYFYDQCQKKVNREFENNLRFEKKFKIESDLLKIRQRIKSLYNCMKITSFRYFDDFLSGDVIPLMKYFELVKDNVSDVAATFNYSKYNSRIYVSEIINKNWIDLIDERIQKLFKGHSLKVHLDGNESEVSARGRRRDHRMFAMMMMGFIIMASVLVPMGFQFLIVLGGKSLLMAKMALIMSAINGLKKIATSNVGYGLYHAPEAFHHDPHHGYHEKVFHIRPQEQPNSPFNIVI